MDLTKEIKISDLVHRTKREPGTRMFPDAEPQKRAGFPLSRRTLRREVVGLKIGATQLAAARVANNGSPKLLQLARDPLQRGIVAGGEVRNVTALGDALDAFFSKHGLPRRDVRVGVATNRIGVRGFELAGMADEHQLANAVQFRAHEALSIPVDAAVLDYRVVSETVNEAGAITRRIVLAAAYRDSIDRFVAACKAARLQLAGIDLEAFALLRALTPPATGVTAARAATVVVAIGHDRTTLAISDGSVCDFVRVLEWGGAALTTAIERTLGVAADEAEKIKLSLSLAPDAADTDGRLVAARNALRDELPTLARELVASLQFYQGQPDALSIGEILITGGTSRLPGLATELARVARVQVRHGDPLARVKVPASVEPSADLPSLAVAIGLGMER